MRTQAYGLANEFVKSPARGELLSAMTVIFTNEVDDSKFDFIITGFNKMPMSNEKVEESPRFASLLLKMNNTDQFKRGVDALVHFRDAIHSEDRDEIRKLINVNFLKAIGDIKKSQGLTDQANYVFSKIN